MIMRRGETTPLRLKTAFFQDVHTPKNRDRSGSFDQFPIRHSRSGSAPQQQTTPPHPQTAQQRTAVVQAAQTINSLSTEADDRLTRALRANEILQRELRDMSLKFKEVCSGLFIPRLFHLIALQQMMELQRTRLELASSKRQTDFVKGLLSDAVAEKEIMYEAFNEELDNMFSNLALPEDDRAWPALVEDLKSTKEEKNQLKQENAYVSSYIRRACH